MDQSSASVPSTMSVAVPAQGRDVLVGHGLGGGEELLAHAFGGAAALAHVAVDAAHQADVVRRVDVDGDVVKRQQLLVVQGENAFDDDDLPWLDAGVAAGDAGMRGEIVDGAVDGLTRGERADVLEDQLGFERVGVVEVALVPRVERELRQVAIVEVEREERCVKLRCELRRERGFAGAGTARDGEHERLVREAELGLVGHGSRVNDALRCGG